MSEMAYQSREEQDRHVLYARIADLEAEVARLREALKSLLSYTVQVEELAYDTGEQIEIHPVVVAATAALRGEGEK